MNKSKDWQIVVIANNFVIEVDCNSGERRKVWKSGEIQKLIDDNKE